MGSSYPEMELIPVLAGVFEVSIDTLFGFHVIEMRMKVENIIKDSQIYFFTDLKRYIQTIKNALDDYPANESLLTALWDAFAYNFRANRCTDYPDEVIETAEQIIAVCGDFMRVCDIKEVQAAAYLKKGNYEKAKDILETLPDIMKNDVIAFHLSGGDKLGGAVQSKCNHLQGLYTACALEGDAWLRMNTHSDVILDADEHTLKAMECYRKGLAALELFLTSDMEEDNLYPKTEMCTAYYCFHQKIAACHKKLGQMDKCKGEVEAAYRIASTTLDGFEEKHEEIMHYFNQHLRDYDLAEFVR